jgi:hypothetical protein
VLSSNFIMASSFTLNLHTPATDPEIELTVLGSIARRSSGDRRCRKCDKRQQNYEELTGYTKETLHQFTPKLKLLPFSRMI